MNKLIRASILAALAAVTLSAQSSTAMRVNVPFEFVVGARTFPAGLYLVDRTIRPETLILKSADRGGGVILMTNAMEAPQRPGECRLVFHRYGTVSFLSEIWQYGGNGRKLTATSREHELAAGLATRDSIGVLASR